MQTKGDKIKIIFYFTINLEATQNSATAENHMQAEFTRESPGSFQI